MQRCLLIIATRVELTCYTTVACVEPCVDDDLIQTPAHLEVDDRLLVQAVFSTYLTIITGSQKTEIITNSICNE